MTADFVEAKPLPKYHVKSGRDILEAQYKSGRSIVEKDAWARQAYDSLRRSCPHVPEEELVRLFHDRSASQLELIQGDATFREYNATHQLGRRKVKVKFRPPPAPVAAPPKAAPKAAAKPEPKKAKKPEPAKAAARPKPRPAPARAPAKKPVAKAAAPKRRR
jgi:hypothetical protein